MYILQRQTTNEILTLEVDVVGSGTIILGSDEENGKEFWWNNVKHIPWATLGATTNRFDCVIPTMQSGMSSSLF